jgi:hypothetical protein
MGMMQLLPRHVGQVRERVTHTYVLPDVRPSRRHRPGYRAMTTRWSTERYLLVQAITGERQAMSQRRRSPLPWILLGGGVWVVAGIVVLIVVLSGGSPTNGPRDVAAKAAAAIGDNDIDRLRDLACDKDDDDDDIVGDVGMFSRGRVESARAGAVLDEDDEDVLIRLEIDYDDGSTRSPKLEIERESGNWCVDDVENF